MTGTSNQTFVVTLVTIVGLIVLIALHDIAVADGLPIIAVLAGVHLGANTLPVAQVTPVTRNSGE